VKILVTAGGTEEPVDAVRRLTNLSTGTTGGVLARHFAERGAEVLLLHSKRTPLSGVPVERETFVTFSDLESALRRALAERRWDAVVHLAAVSDYSVASIELDGHVVSAAHKGKIGSDREVAIRLRPNPKLIDSIKKWAREPKPLVIAFKLTDTTDPAEREAQVRRLLDRGTTDLVVHNDLHDIGGGQHLATIHDRRRPLVQTTTKEQLAHELFCLMLKGVSR
jgi:phosphopantothenoylcysteine decarboxylase/phosphopantothenate--cysteine ligase